MQPGATFECPHVTGWVLSRYSGYFLPQSKDMHVGLIGSSQLSLGLCHLSLCIDPVVTSDGTWPFFPKAAGILVIPGEEAIENG